MDSINETICDRSLPLFGDEGMRRIARARVVLFGIGGVGGACAEALVRGGVRLLTLVDGDVFTPSNLNRQRFAYVDSLGKNKTEFAAGELRRMVPEAEITPVASYFTPQTEFDFSAYDYVIDAIDDLPAKIALIERAGAAGVPVVSACGAGNKLDASRFRVSDIYSTSVCPLARALRKACRERGIASLKVVWSDESPAVVSRVPASASFVPPVAGLMLAGEALKSIAGLARPLPQ